MTGRRLALVAAAHGVSTALCVYDYALGFTVLLAFSLAHIVLEFPLNTLALRQLGKRDRHERDEDRRAGAAVGWAKAAPTPAEMHVSRSAVPTCRTQHAWARRIE